MLTQQCKGQLQSKYELKKDKADKIKTKRKKKNQCNLYNLETIIVPATEINVPIYK
jgi:hypothetical protein